MNRLHIGLNITLMVFLLLSGLAFLTMMNIHGVFLALISLMLSWGVFRRHRWAYFGSAAWGLAGYQLAKEGLEFEAIKRAVMILGFVVIIVSVYLHEKLGRKPESDLS